MLKRKIENQFIEWKNRPDHRALLVMGARQVGKTTSIRAFAQKWYEHKIEINFETRPSLKAIFDGDLDPTTIYEKMSVADLGELVPGRTLFFFDEIQACPRARTAIKFLVEDGRFDIIESGSLLGINYADVSSYPVGFEEKIDMHSLDFEEFLWALGIPATIIAGLRERYDRLIPVDPFVHARLMEAFKRYLILGGMPSVIDSYLEMKDIAKSVIAQRAIIGGYRDDIAKYAGGLKVLAKAVFDSIPSQLQEKNRKFVLADIETGASFRRFNEPIQWLSDAGIASFCFNISAWELPLEPNAQRTQFKFFLRDTGLLSSMSMANVQQAILNGELEVNQGAIVENAVADLLVKNGHALHYYDRKGRLEIDFALQMDDAVVPVEVKSGMDHRKHASLTKLLEEHPDDLPAAIVLCRENVSVAGRIRYLPLYMVMFL